MTEPLNGKRVAFLVTDGFEQVEFTEPFEAIRAAGADVEVIAPKTGTVQGMDHLDRADTFGVDHAASSVAADLFRNFRLMIAIYVLLPACDPDRKKHKTPRVIAETRLRGASMPDMSRRRRCHPGRPGRYPAGVPFRLDFTNPGSLTRPH